MARLLLPLTVSGRSGATIAPMYWVPLETWLEPVSKSLEEDNEAGIAKMSPVPAQSMTSIGIPAS
jgi:hypothetical protein